MQHRSSQKDLRFGIKQTQIPLCRILKPLAVCINLRTDQGMLHNFTEAHKLYGDELLGFSEGQMHLLLEQAGFSNIDICIAAREEDPPHFETLLISALKKES